MKRNGWLALFLCLWQAFLLPSEGRCQQKNAGKCKLLAIHAAQLADASYIYSKASYFSQRPGSAANDVDSAQAYLLESISRLDSAILLAPDSNVLGIGYAKLAKRYARGAYITLQRYKQSGSFSQKRDLAHSAVRLTQNAVIDAYHSSFYFTDAAPKQKEEPKPAKKDSTPRQVTRLDVDQAMFALLDEQLLEKEDHEKKLISKLQEEIKKEKDPAKAAKLKAELKKAEIEEGELEKKEKDAKEKLTQINTQLDERNGTSIATAEDASVFSKMTRPTDQWDKQILEDSDLPMKLTYLVQIGVYKNAVSPEAFKGITPLFIRPMPNGVSYSTGMFTKLSDASQAKKYLQSMGLVDAFVVPYHKQKKISITEATKLEKEGGQ